MWANPADPVSDEVEERPFMAAQPISPNASFGLQALKGESVRGEVRGFEKPLFHRAIFTSSPSLPAFTSHGTPPSVLLALLFLSTCWYFR